MKRSIVTGGGGFLGINIVKMLRARGDDVIALGRNPYPEVEALGAHSRVADIRDPKALRELFAGADEVYHAAAIALLWGRWKDFYSINYEGTLNVIEACRDARVPKLIYTSSPSVIFNGQSQRNVNEDADYPNDFLADYPKTKAMAEKAVLNADGVDGLHTVALRPHLIWGPGDRHLIPRLVARARAGRLMRIGDGTNLVDIIYVDNAAKAHLQAAEELGDAGKCNGKAYFLSQGEPVRLWQFVGEILERADAPPVKRSISFRKAYRIGSAMEMAYKVLRKTSEPRMTRFLACQLATDHYYDTSRAKEDFGYAPEVSTSVGLSRLFAENR